MMMMMMKAAGMNINVIIFNGPWIGYDLACLCWWCWACSQWGDSLCNARDICTLPQGATNYWALFGHRK